MDVLGRVPEESIGVAAGPAALLGELLHNAPRFEALSSVEPFAGFVDAVFPHYVDAMQEGSFFLSDLELLTVCQCAGRNVAIVRYDDEQEQLTLHRWAAPGGMGAEFTWVAIHARDNVAAVRSHFERLEQAEPPLAPPPPHPEPRPRRGRSALPATSAGAGRAGDAPAVPAGSARVPGRALGALPPLTDSSQASATSLRGPARESADMGAARGRADALPAPAIRRGTDGAESTDAKHPMTGAAALMAEMLECGLEDADGAPKEDGAASSGAGDAADLSDRSVGDEDSDAEDIFAVGECEASSLEAGYADNFLYRWLLATQEVRRLLRRDALLPMHPDLGEAGVAWTRVDEAVVLPAWHCAFQGCTACSAGWEERSSHEAGLWNHLWNAHRTDLEGVTRKYKLLEHVLAGEEVALTLYTEALAEVEREGCPRVGVATDRRAMLHLGETFKDDNVSTLMCFICGCKHIRHNGYDKFGRKARKRCH